MYMCEIFITGKQQDVHPKQDSRSSPHKKKAHLQKLGDKKLAFARRQILQQSSTLIVHLYFLQVVLSVLFLKSTKNGAVVYGIRCFLCSRVALRHLSVGAHLAARYLSQCLGRQELAALKHHATCFQALLGCSLCLPTLPFRPWREITFCNEQARRIVNLNTATVENCE